MASAHGSQLSGVAQGLLDPAWQMRWRVPELTLMLSDQAVAEARRIGDRALRLRAEALALFSLNRLGRGVAATERAIAAVRDAESSGDEATTQLRVELACCARSSGSQDVALRLLYPVLEQERVDPTARAHALIELATSLPAHRNDSERLEALDEAERLYAASTEVNRDTTRLLRARVSTVRAGHHRRHSEFAAAVEAAAAGLALLAKLGDPATDSGEIHARLVLERVHALLELGQRDEAVQAARPVVNQPVRAAVAGPAGWLRLVLATRIHLPDGEHGTAVRLLNDAVSEAERHDLEELLAETLSTLSHVYERSEDVVGALRCVRRAYGADRRWRTSVHNARVRLLEEFPAKPGVPSVPTQPTPARSTPAQPPPARSAPTQSPPAQPPPTQSTPAQPPPAQPSPTQSTPAQPMPAQPSPTQSTAHRRQADSTEDVREAARRLMATLTSGPDDRNASRSGGPTAEPRRSQDNPSQDTPSQDTPSQGTQSPPGVSSWASAEPRPAVPEQARADHSRAGHDVALEQSASALEQAGWSTPVESEHFPELAQNVRRVAQNPVEPQGQVPPAPERSFDDAVPELPMPDHPLLRDVPGLPYTTSKSASPQDFPMSEAAQVGSSMPEFPAQDFSMPAFPAHDSSPPYREQKTPRAQPSAESSAADPVPGQTRGIDLGESEFAHYEFSPYIADSEASSSESTGRRRASPESWTSAEQGVDRGLPVTPTAREDKVSHSEYASQAPTSDWESSIGRNSAPPPDVTAIMPVIAVPPDPVPGGWPVEDESQADRIAPGGAVEASASPLPAYPAAEVPQRQHTPVEAAHADPLGIEPASAPPRHDVGATAAETGTGRRSRGKSLAEIRASLRVVQNSTPGRRSHHAAEPVDPQEAGANGLPADEPRPRHAEPAASGNADAEVSDEYLSQHRQLQDGLPPVEVGRQAEPVGEVGLADLLAEALVAYEHGRRDQQPEAAAHRASDADDAPSYRRHGASSVSGITDGARPVAARPVQSTEDTGEPVVRARHRHAVEGRQSWTPQGY